MPVYDLPHLTNQEFFYEYTRPGMLGLIGGTGPGRLMSTGVRWLASDALMLNHPASYWSHVFIVLDRKQTRTGWDISIIESTIVSRFHRTLEGKRLNKAHWNGPQISTLIRKADCGRATGGDGRKRVRQYIDDEFTPNVALIDLRFNEKALATLRKKAMALLANKSTYYKREILGVLCAALDDKLAMPNPLDKSGLNCTAFVRACLDPLVPAFRAIPANQRNTFPEHFYQAALPEFDIYQTIRETAPAGLTGFGSKAILSVMRKVWRYKSTPQRAFGSTPGWRHAMNAISKQKSAK
jgi:hypothetical protein